MLRVDTTSPGHDQTVAFFYQSDFVGRPCAPSAAHRVTALTDVELCSLPRGLSAIRNMGNELVRPAFDDLDRSRRWLLPARRSGEAKVASLFAFMRKRLGPKGGRFDLPLTRGAMADVLGLSMETNSRLVRDA